MLLEPRPLHNVIHPYIESIYIRKEFGADPWQRGKDVLIIEARNDGRKDALTSLLSDLDLIRDEVERKAGKFSRIDIRCH